MFSSSSQVTSGPTQVVAVLAVSAIGLDEPPVFCRYDSGTRAPHAPASRPLDPGTFTPATVDPRVFTVGGVGWGLRFLLDGLLDAAVLTQGNRVLQPGMVSLTCGPQSTPVSLTGTYTTGSGASFPSILVFPSPAELVFPTGTECTASLSGQVVNSSGIPVPEALRSHVFRLAPLRLITIDTGRNGPESSNLPGNAIHVFAFNASLSDQTLQDTDFQILNDMQMPVTESVRLLFSGDWALNRDPDAVELNDGAFFRAFPYLTPGSYTARLTPGEAIAEIHGGTLVASETDLSQAFTVAYGIVSSTPVDGAGVPTGADQMGPPVSAAIAASADLLVRFNGPLLAASVGPEDVTLRIENGNAVPFALGLGSGSNADKLVVDPGPSLTPGITYVLTLPAGASFTWDGSCPPGAAAQCRTATLAADRSIRFRVQ